MVERSDEWPRVHTCLYDWCPEKHDDCRRCDAIVKITEEVTAGLRKELGNDLPQIARG